MTDLPAVVPAHNEAGATAGTIDATRRRAAGSGFRIGGAV